MEDFCHSTHMLRLADDVVVRPRRSSHCISQNSIITAGRFP